MRSRTKQALDAAGTIAVTVATYAPLPLTLEISRLRVQSVLSARRADSHKHHRRPRICASNSQRIGFLKRRLKATFRQLPFQSKKCRQLLKDAHECRSSTSMLHLKFVFGAPRYLFEEPNSLTARNTEIFDSRLEKSEALSRLLPNEGPASPDPNLRSGLPSEGNLGNQPSTASKCTLTSTVLSLLNVTYLPSCRICRVVERATVGLP